MVSKGNYMRAIKKTKKLIAEVPALLKLDLGCGPNKREGFIGVDALEFGGKVDCVLDLKKGPWPWSDGQVSEVHCSHFLEHLTGAERVPFFNELYRVMAKDAKATIIVPSWTSERAYGDPTHQWPPVVGMFFFYLDKIWRQLNAPHCGLNCDFHFIGGNIIGAPWNLKTQEVQAFSQTHYLNVAQDMIVTLTRR